MPLLDWQKQLMGMSQRTARKAVDPCFSKNLMPTPQTAQRLDAYQHNYQGGLIEALKIAYPQILSLVGEAFFQQLAYEYLECHPLTESNHSRYGEYLSQFIAKLSINNQALTPLPYLADVAKSDWALYLSYYAATRSQFDVKAFSQLEVSSQTHAMFHIADDIHLIDSRWPLAQLWQFYIEGSQGMHLERAEQPQTFIVHRPEYKPQLCVLSEVEADLLHAIKRGTRIDSLPESSAELLPRLIVKGWVSEFRLT